MRNSVVKQLVCVTNGCSSKLNLESIRSNHDDCIEGFLHCNKCKAVYPILDGVAVIVNNFAAYTSERPKILGSWLLQSKSRSMKEFLQENAKRIKETSENRYEAGGAWFLPYLNMHSRGSKVDKHFARIVKRDFGDFYRNVAKLILRRFSSKRLCLDLGCAIGTITKELAKKHNFVFGVDQSFSFIREARRRKSSSNIEFLVSNSLQLPFPKSKFDLIVSLNLIDLVDPKRLLPCIHSLLARDGNVVLTDPYDFRDDKGNPRPLYNGKSFRKLLTDNGFSVDQSTASESFIPWILRVHNRAYLVYFADLVIARKSSV